MGSNPCSQSPEAAPSPASSGGPPEPAADAALPTEPGSTHLARQAVADVVLSQEEWVARLPAAAFAVLRRKATEPRGCKFPQGFDDHFERGSYLCAGCLAAGLQVALYTDRMKFDCGCGWPGFWTNVKDAVVEVSDKDGSRREIVCARCEGHLGHVFRGERFGHCTDERHCVNSVSLVFAPAAGGGHVCPTFSGKVHGG